MTSVVIGLRVVSLAGAVHHSVEAVVLIGRVLDGTNGAIGVVDGVLSLDHVTVAYLPLRLVVPGVWVVYGVIVLVLGVGLQHARRCQHGYSSLC